MSQSGSNLTSQPKAAPYNVGDMDQQGPVVIAQRAPTVTDRRYPIGKIWIDQPANSSYILTSVVAGQANWDINGSSGSTSLSQYVVSADGTGDYLTVQAGLNAAGSAGGGTVYVKPGIYTENLTFPSGGPIGLVSAGGDENAPVVEIIGVHVPSPANDLVVWRIQMTSSTDIFNSSAAGTSNITLVHNNYSVDGYLWNLPNWTGALTAGLIADRLSTASGICYNTAGAPLTLLESSLGVGTSKVCTANGPVLVEVCNINCPMAISGSSTYSLYDSNFYDAIVFSGSSSGFITSSYFPTGSAIPITQSSSGAMALSGININSSATNVIAGTGVGVITASMISFLSSSGIANTLTLTPGKTFTGGVSVDSSNYVTTFKQGTFTPTITGSSTNPTVTYTLQTGRYFQINNMVTVSGSITVNAYSGGSGNLQITGLPTAAFATTPFIGSVALSTVTFAGVGLYCTVAGGASVLNVAFSNSTTTPTTLAVGAAGAGSIITFDITYAIA